LVSGAERRWARFCSASPSPRTLALNNRPVRWVLDGSSAVATAAAAAFSPRRTFSASRGGAADAQAQSAGRAWPTFWIAMRAYCDPQSGEADRRRLATSRLRRLRAPDQRSSGAAPLAYGDVDTARDIASAIWAAPFRLTREGFTIICSEPQRADVKQDYLDLYL